MSEVGLFILFRYRRSLKLSSNFTFQVSLVWFLILTHYDSYRDKQVIKWERLPASTVKVVTCLLATNTSIKLLQGLN